MCWTLLDRRPALPEPVIRIQPGQVWRVHPEYGGLVSGNRRGFINSTLAALATANAAEDRGAERMAAAIRRRTAERLSKDIARLERQL